MEDKVEFWNKFPDVDFTAVNAAVSLCKCSDEEKKKLFKDGKSDILDANKIYMHSQCCVWCQNWLAWHKAEEERYIDNYPALSKSEMEQLQALRAAYAR